MRTYQPIIQKTIDYIEGHLEQRISLESVAAYAGFSKYHFHRLFQKEVGLSVMEYVRFRRLRQAAQLLIYSHYSILDIAIYYCFETQESFTRAFRKVYHMPPGQYRKMMSQILQVKGEQSMGEQNIKGWFLSGSHPFLYEMGLDRKVVHHGNTSGYLKSKMVESEEEFATMMQQFKADRFIGNRMKLSAFVKTRGVEGFCGLWMRVDSKTTKILQFDNMADRPITGTTNWNHYSIVLDIPEESATISFGVLLSGRGHVWVDQFQFEAVEKDIPTTNNLEMAGAILEEPINLTFEEE